MRTVQRLAQSAALLIALAGVSPALAQSTMQPTPAGQTRPESLSTGFIILVKDKAGTASASSPIYVASNHIDWNAGRGDMVMSARSDGLWQIELPAPTSTEPMEFKFTRGSWDNCEVNADLTDAMNRHLPGIDASKLKPGEKPVLYFEVPAWTDQRPEINLRLTLTPYRALNVTGDVRRLQVTGGAGPSLGLVRDLLVALPPGYDEPANAGRRYPVLYLMDGQNVFEKMPGTPDEWHADEALQKLVSTGEIEPVIIVGIPHTGPNRAAEYLPYAAIDGVEPCADEFLSWMQREVMPRVERSFRVDTGPARTGIGGASLGGVVSLYAATKHPETFGLCLAESVSTLRGAQDEWRSYLTGSTSWPSRLFIGMGDHEAGFDASATDLNKTYTAWANELTQIAKSGGKGRSDVTLVIGRDSTHNETAWASRFEDALRKLYPPRSSTPSHEK
ncbi:MAG: alpha/beta hydrolase-fold protein [Phycisphaerales bacterium]|jgi:predicted alpha/beta superfamily hydrolase|nr:alpha/beta hydrolase-fold protein [Phycisphaerales bacterium]